MNKGLAIGIGIVIVIGGIGVAYSLFMNQNQETPGQETGMGMTDTAEVTVINPTEQEEPEQPVVEINVKEGIGIKTTP